jgi:hypothetical protein
MELLIPGLILVALMIYASTRIKKTAAAAFEAETVETEHFTFEKPEGLLLVINGDQKLDAEGYSREYGENDDASQRQIRFAVTRTQGASPDAVGTRVTADAKVVSRETGMVGGTKFTVIEAVKTKDGFTSREFHKIGAAGDNVFDLCVTSLEELDLAAKRRIDQMISSFVLKS